MTWRWSGSATVRLGLNKGERWARLLIDDHLGGYAGAVRQAAEWSGRWVEATPSLLFWLHRLGAGRLWIDASVGPRWARRRCSADDLAFAEEVVVGRISVLGADPVVGNPPRWLRDGYTGTSWPLRPASHARLNWDCGGDIRTVWELGRCYHFTLLAKAYWRTGDARFIETFRNHVESWLQENPVGKGPNWWSPMDAAIRGANWALAAVLFARAPGLTTSFWSGLLANLRLTARFVERQLEWHPRYRGNHYVANGVGLVYIGAVFRDDPDGARWLHLGADILEQEIARQVHADGVSFEAAIGYHRLVTEFFAWGGEVVRRNLPGRPSAAYWQRLRSMYVFLESYLDSSGRAPLLGDADDGRLHHLCAKAAAEPRRHRLGLPPWHRPRQAPTSRAFGEGGFYVLRAGADRCVVRCGPVGLAGAGSHDHNDQLSYELVLAGQELISDSGTYAYTRDLASRLAYRATSAHNAVQLGHEEQNPIRVDRPWRVLADRTRAVCTWTDEGGLVSFAGRHSGYLHRASGAICSRRIGLDTVVGTWRVEDEVEGAGRERLTWRLHLAPGVADLEPAGAGHWLVRHQAAPGHAIFLSAPAGLAPVLQDSPWSERYGVAVARRVIVLDGTVDLPVRIVLEIRPEPARVAGAGL